MTKNAIHRCLATDDGNLKIMNFEFRREDYNRIFFVGIGKCAVDAGLAVEEILGEKITDGVIVDVKEGTFKKMRSFLGTHPFPSEQNVLAAKEVAEMLKNLTEKDLVLTVISGGGSSLLSLPHGISPEMLTKITKTLMDKGAPIGEVNIIRKHLSDIQGGFLAKMAYPATVISLLFSDVPGNDISTIASGPTVLDKSTKKDAEELIERYEILKECGLQSLDIVETPKEEKYFREVHNLLIVTNLIALDAMTEKAKELGYFSLICTDCGVGEAREFGKKMVSEERAKGCYFYGGETTVTSFGKRGKGGRNQEVVLGALPHIGDNMVIVAAASDGWDNGESAGAMGDKELFVLAEQKGISPKVFLDENNSFEFFEKAGGHIFTGRTGANVADLYFVLTK